MRGYRLAVTLILGATVALVTLAPDNVRAGVSTVYMVDRTDDANVFTCTVAPNDCTLRGALGAANVGGTFGDTIRFDPVVFPSGAPATITIGSLLPAMTSSGDVIDGKGSGVIVKGNGEPAAHACLTVSTSSVDITGIRATDCTVGINVTSGNYNTIGPANILYDNSSGVQLGSDLNEVFGNFIGTTADGTAVHPDGGNTASGINVLSSDNIIGGAERNIISGNGLRGVYLQSLATGNSVVGNYIGTDVTGTVDLGNTEGGISISGDDNIIGGSAVGSGNVVSGNNLHGVYITSSGNELKGNFIGTDATGTQDLGNGQVGVWLNGGGNFIGGSAAGEGNVVSGNGLQGVYLTGVASSSNVIQGNRIGVGADNGPLGNGSHGIVATMSASANRIGGSTAGSRNQIYYNGADGIALLDGINNTIDQNQFVANQGLAIDIADDGATLNDAGDADTGPNNRQNFPVLTVASTGGVDTLVEGTLNSAPSVPYIIRLYETDGCDPSGHGEGEAPIATLTPTTDGAGNATFTTAIDPIQPGFFITATARVSDPTGDTSEFSLCRQVVFDADSDDDGITDAAESACDSNVHDPNSIPERIDGVFAGADDDGNTLVDEPLPGGAGAFDCDGDGYIGDREYGAPLCGNGINDDDLDDGVVDDGCLVIPTMGAFAEGQFNIGTNDQDPCGNNGWPSDVFPDPPSANKLDIQDITAFVLPTRRLDTTPGNPNFDSRYDLLPGRGIFGQWINIQDITTLVNGPPGSPAFPPMLQGLRAFTRTCPWP